ncbi:MAG: hypothetical protein AAF458_01620 [Pseudomonadota bacterium]
MPAFIASLVNALLLIGLGAWGYLSSDNPSVTALIPVGFGIALVLLSPGVRKQAKVRAHIAAVLTLLIFFGLIKPFMGALDRDSTLAIVRVGIMQLSTVIAFVFFVKSFIDARKARES